ncbi:MAG: LysR family transcriptional regulator [Pseudomonadota bacterium]
MDILRAMRVFVAVVDYGGFSAAARHLGVSGPAVTKQIKQLESHIGTQLLQRSTRRVSATDAGRRFRDACTMAIEGVDRAIGTAGGQSAEPFGQLRVNAPMTFGTKHLSPMVLAFKRRYPKVRVELALNDRVVDPLEEGFDVSLRIGREQESTSLVSRTIAPAHLALAAAPAYLDRAALLESPADLRHHDCLHYGYQQTGQRWRFGEGRDASSVAIGCVFWSNNGDVLREAALAGAGIVMLPTFIIGGDFQDGGLVRLLPNHPISSLSIQALYSRSSYVSATVTAFVEFLADNIGPRPQWDLLT